MSVGGFIGRRAVVWRVRSGRPIAVARRVMIARLMCSVAIARGMAVVWRMWTAITRLVWPIATAGRMGSAIMRWYRWGSARLPAVRHIT